MKKKTKPATKTTAKKAPPKSSPAPDQDLRWAAVAAAAEIHWLLEDIPPSTSLYGLVDDELRKARAALEVTAAMLGGDEPEDMTDEGLEDAVFDPQCLLVGR